MAPVRANYNQTYVDQYVPLPFEDIRRRAVEEQANFDAPRNNWAALQAKMSADVMHEDKDRLNQKLSQYQQAVGQAIDNHDGDWRKMSGVVGALASDWNREKMSGSVGKWEENKKIYTPWKESVDKSDMYAEDKELMNYTGLGMYKQAQQYDPGAKFQTIAPYKVKDFQQLALNAIKALDSKDESVASAGYNQDGSLIVDYKSNTKTLDPKRIRAAVETTIGGDKDFNDMVQTRWKLRKDNGLTNLNLEQFKQQELNNMFKNVEAYAYTKNEKWAGAKETAEAGEIAKQKYTLAEPVMSSSMQMNFGQNKDHLDIANSKDPFGALNMSYQKGLDAVNESLISSYKTAFPGSNKEQVKLKLNEFAQDQGFDLRNRYDQRKYLEGIANGSVDLTRFANTDARKAQIKAQAKDALSTWKENDQIKLNVFEDAASEGIIDQKDYKNYRSALDGLNKKLSQTEKAYKETTDKAYKKKLLAEIKDLEEARGAGVASGNFAGTAGITSAIQTAQKQGRIVDKEVALYYDAVQRLEKDLMDHPDDNKRLQGMLKTRLSKNTAINLDASTSIPMFDDKGNVSSLQGQKFVNGMGMQMAAKKEEVLNSLVIDPETGERNLTLKDHLVKRATRLASEGAYKDAGTALAALENQIFPPGKPASVMVASSFHPHTGNYMAKLGGRYVMELSPQSGNINFTELEKTAPDVKDQMAINTLVNKGLMGAASKTQIFDGVYISVKQPGHKEKVDHTFDSTLPDGKAYRVTVDDGNGGYKDLPASHGRELALRLSALNRSKSPDGTVEVKMNGRLVRLPVEEVEKEYIKHYAR
jgi:hypothetical protein